MSLSLVGISSSLSIGGEVFTDLTNLIRLVAGTGTTNTNTTFRISNGTAGYQVPLGFKLVIRAIRMQSKVAVLSQNTFFYSDNDMGANTATAPTNPVYIGGASVISELATSATGAVSSEIGGLEFEIPAGKYFGMSDQSASAAVLCHAFGYLVAV